MTSTTPTDESGRIPWIKIACWFVLSRLLILFVAQLALLGVAKGQFFHEPTSLLESFVRWDVGWYSGISQVGYTYNPNAGSSVAFLPLFPILMKPVTMLVGNSVLAGVLVANTCLLLAAGLLWRLAREVSTKAQVADDTVAFLLLSPVGFFFSSAFSESLFLLCLLGSVRFAMHRNWLMAGLCGYLAAVTRAVGVMIVIPLVWEWIRQGNYRSGRPLTRRVVEFIACGLPGVGLASYFAYLYFKFGDFMAYFHTQQFWYAGLNWPTVSFHNTYANTLPFYGWWFTFAFVAAIAGIVVGWKLKVPSLHLVLACAFTGIYICKGHLDSLPRYLSVVYPFYLVEALAVQRWPSTAKWLWTANGLFLALSTVLFVTGFYFS
ncbi:MAG: hypothetical protein JWM32_2986 [Verrucomicrobia bacterium]|nr:hypothetical protein [Verrucomicrobiota bacterium]